ncbi:hypothetical protein WQ54_19975 [Bacillus sp. SA1-12]|uniref:hypothetical protein n=1 Tax=Bacillus sp. SA1-12 TaxID=1455638 RepID=UPI000626F711|nr:hypothetical protein [Bacillus sp. SA1-12]KKI90260.1 hypothetical protein WQ54_19975 [Bacillus sp. SA1-12]
MSKDFFANYKEYILIPMQEEKIKQKKFDPDDYASHYILTLSLYDSLLSSWNEAEKYEIDVKKSIEKVLKEINQSHEGVYHFQLLELEVDKSYFVLSLSCKAKIEEKKAEDSITYIIDKMISNPFYVRQSWFRLIGNKGRIKRKLFCFSFKEYIYEKTT